MKKIAVLIHIIVIIFSVSACSANTPNITNESNVPQAQEADTSLSGSTTPIYETAAEFPTKQEEEGANVTAETESSSAELDLETPVDETATDTAKPESTQIKASPQNTAVSDNHEAPPVTDPPDESTAAALSDTNPPPETTPTEPQTPQPEPKPTDTQETLSEPKPTEPQETKSETQSETTSEPPAATEEENNMKSIEIIVGNNIFTATLYDNDAAKALQSLLPMTLNMSELNGNEKYYYLSDSLPTDSSRPSGIHTGDLMLYGNNCLVLFYESFSTSYSYTPLGYIDNTDGLAAALGSGNVQVTFR